MNTTENTTENMIANTTENTIENTKGAFQIDEVVIKQAGSAN